VRPRLLDVSLLLALAWPFHVHHSQAQAWFAKKRRMGFRTCPLTELGFVRISINPNFTARAVSARAALELLARITALAEHEFWPDDRRVSEAIGREQPIVGHRQVTDAYLLALAESRDGVVATLDRGMLSMAAGREGLVEIVEGW